MVFNILHPHLLSICGNDMARHGKKAIAAMLFGAFTRKQSCISTQKYGIIIDNRIDNQRYREECTSNFTNLLNSTFSRILMPRLYYTECAKMPFLLKANTDFTMRIYPRQLGIHHIHQTNSLTTTKHFFSSHCFYNATRYRIMELVWNI